MCAVQTPSKFHSNLKFRMAFPLAEAILLLLHDTNCQDSRKRTWPNLCFRRGLLLLQLLLLRRRCLPSLSHPLAELGCQFKPESHLPLSPSRTSFKPTVAAVADNNKLGARCSETAYKELLFAGSYHCHIMAVSKQPWTLYFFFFSFLDNVFGLPL